MSSEADELSAALVEAREELDYRDVQLADAAEVGRRLIRERDAAQRREELMRPVVEKGRVVVARWKAEGFVPGTGWTTPDADDFAAAVDTYETQTGGTE